jgi:hypothetical protein
MVTYSDLQSQLNSAWNTGVIAKPTFKDGKQTKDNQNATLYITVGNSKSNAKTTGYGAKDEIMTPFFIRIIASSQTNVDLYLDEVRRIMDAKIVTNGQWHIDGWVFKQVASNLYQYNCNGTEVYLDI